MNIIYFSGASELYILARENAIGEWRKLMGPTKVFKTQFEVPASIRGIYGYSDTRNATHGSDSEESAKREIGIFFPEFNYENWFEKEEPKFRDDNVEFLNDLFLHRIKNVRRVNRI
ncbi:nucleoside diphosphate kinase 6 [Holotrichia oblita]|uniref:Nucleoside diphosphate kinase 6 n=1 Tax=Holotrichia oblita TaxID=644536 RepID=A0ACB9SN32_HOLOL|nr:nucleoside diphosphate kinase 6 [Holotrichia oblita]